MIAWKRKRAKQMHLSHLMSEDKIPALELLWQIDLCTMMNDASSFCEDMGEVNSPLPGVMSYFS